MCTYIHIYMDSLRRLQHDVWLFAGRSMIGKHVVPVVVRSCAGTSQQACTYAESVHLFYSTYVSKRRKPFQINKTCSKMDPKYVMGAGSVASWDFLGPLAPILSPRNPDSRTTIEKDMDRSPHEGPILDQNSMNNRSEGFPNSGHFVLVYGKSFWYAIWRQLCSILAAKTVPKLRTYSKLNQKI